MKNKPERSQKYFGKAGHLAIAKVQVRDDGLNGPGEKMHRFGKCAFKR